MSDIAIHCEGLGKQYRIGRRESYKTLRDTLTDAIRDPLRRLRTNFQGSKIQTENGNHTIWALKDVSFEVKCGDVVGIIGRNGAGKSTLLKILSRITKPTAGYAEIHGRVGSLLEVGTGFHPELTGRENIYLNGSILGMKRDEIERKFDEIVAFSEVEKFIDTTVKHYSSGMYLRLAFAVAAHLEPEILIVDEVLAVGDAAFQKKCLGKMEDIAQEGRTVLFVSHNMNAIQRLCRQSMMLEEGQLIAFDQTMNVLAKYLASGSDETAPACWIDVSNARRSGTGEARFQGVYYSSLNAASGFYPYTNGPLEFLIDIDSDSQRSVKSIAVTLYDQYGTKLVNAESASIGRIVTLLEGRNVLRIKINHLYLNSGVYVLGLWVASDVTGDYFDRIESAFKIEVVDLVAEGFGYSQAIGVVSCDYEISEEVLVDTINYPV